MVQYFKLLSSLSASDLKNSATTWGMSEVLDTPNSVQWLTRASQDPNSSTASVPSGTTSGYATGQPGVGLCNNQVLGFSLTVGLGFQAGSGLVHIKIADVLMRHFLVGLLVVLI
jgi:hypothetical protein